MSRLALDRIALARLTQIRAPRAANGIRNMSSIARTKSLDHLVLTVKDLEATVKFYECVLGMKHTSFTSGGQERHALVFGQQKINLHISGKEFEPKAQIVQPGSGDLCFLVEDNVDEVARKLHENKIEVLEGGGVVNRTGARSKLRSVYVRDPDGNLVELSNETT
ncbi:Glyoxalase/Bleomycin resistance protein/Dihydroxybiphenyl dioxygenase [Truncatella angustata]|uniref:Glyoxalase/Bleomycin resistance protein/Dihydroxybiphenyl dioxygenase n=1 Tax=Truncatella angustata TaxID=152316 RepID=A0A9P9A0L1_9PEZI|nr:Glyoxalase/Bleomycin resistance protein/Dihydroxybiphenyl dioxygenase [Truncatella angustata]KAH6657199.1 Glyoxalase/Bleomycin resistance protein/Dihydroxybiphenyl dioxygenase [Truncatella angustata]